LLANIPPGTVGSLTGRHVHGGLREIMRLGVSMVSISASRCTRDADNFMP
jgi:hypothetical protein